MQEPSVVLSLHPPALSKGGISVELDHLAAVIVQHLLKQQAGVAYPLSKLESYLAGCGLSWPNHLEFKQLIKQLHEAAKIVGLPNLILQLSSGLLLNNKQPIVCEEDEGPDLLDLIYSDLRKPH